MSKLPPATSIERVAGHALTESALTVVATLAAGPLAALLPVLTKSLASERQKQRVEQAFADVSAILEDHKAQIRNLTDEQYKIVNEAVLAMLHTTEAEKLTYLRAAVRNAFRQQDLRPQEAIALSRIVRDISSDEAKFVCENFHYEGIQLIPRGMQDAQNGSDLCVDPESHDAQTVAGLTSLGLLMLRSSTIDGSGTLRFSRTAAKLIALLQME